MFKLVLTIAASVAALPALAQNAPANLRPTRDVAVTYRMEGPAVPQPQEVRMAWDVAKKMQRIDPPGGQGWMLLDLGAGSAVMVMEAQRMVMTLPAQTAVTMTQGVPPGTTFTRKGTDQVAGVSCNLWDTVMPQGQSSICLTEDGVLLRAVAENQAQGTSRMEATEVHYGEQDAARFQVPEGYRRMTVPNPAPAGGTPAR
ncbi:MAG TPA: hypothetical protein VIL69_10380 [Roseomonas sp.]|jgi:hypothetical protein